jgi:hypothetical protein
VRFARAAAGRVAGRPFFGANKEMNIQKIFT